MRIVLHGLALQITMNIQKSYFITGTLIPVSVTVHTPTNLIAVLKFDSDGINMHTTCDM